MSNKPCTNDIFSPNFESKMDPLFRSSHVPRNRHYSRRGISSNEARSSFVITKKPLKQPK